jgi:hypothetical protein
VADALAEAKAALARGDVLVAFDHASSALEADPDALDARYVAALSLARAGAPERAERAAEELRARLARTPGAPPSLREDADALVARLAKDRALRSEGEARAAGLREAATRYAAVAEAFGSHFAAVNAATLWLLAGDRARARELAALARTLAGTAARPGDRYWRAATLAEAALVLGEVDAARGALAEAAALAGPDVAALATTRRQLRLVCDASGTDARVLAEIAPPGVVHFCGTRSLPNERAHELRASVREYVDRRRVGFGFGSLAAGADILIAEVLLDAGAEVHIVLPFDSDAFERTSVEPAGVEWVERFRKCAARATTVTYASDSEYLDDDELFRHAARIAMGHAVNRSRLLDAEVEQVALWDGADRGAPAGTARDVEQWHALGLPSHIVSVANDDGARPEMSHAPRPARAVRGILFADFRGFSRLRDQQFATFVEVVMGALADVLGRHGDAVLWRNTWGDAVQAICDDVVTTAACALGFQEAVAGLDLARAGLPEDLHLRIGAHVGPVIPVRDRVLGREAYMGRELTRAARIEPLTPTGEVYVTDAFAAVLAIDGRDAYLTEYVGRITTAKNFETIPMYRLRRAH